MQATSHLYQHEHLRTPSLLALGLLDRRVDAEQTRRLLRLLRLNGHSPRVVWFENDGHAIAGVKPKRRLWRGVAGFLGQHLGTSTPIGRSDVE